MYKVIVSQKKESTLNHWNIIILPANLLWAQTWENLTPPPKHWRCALHCEGKCALFCMFVLLPKDDAVKNQQQYHSSIVPTLCRVPVIWLNTATVFPTDLHSMCGGGSPVGYRPVHFYSSVCLLHKNISRFSRWSEWKWKFILCH